MLATTTRLKRGNNLRMIIFSFVANVWFAKQTGASFNYLLHLLSLYDVIGIFSSELTHSLYENLESMSTNQRI
jgi:hypothetical protein